MMMYRYFTRAAAALSVVAMSASAAYAAGVHIIRPANGAIIRETVPIRVAAADLPPDGYAVITIDGHLKTARVLPQGGGTVYVWDTKATYVLPEDELTPLKVEDGKHTIQVTIYDSSSNRIGTDQVDVRVANKITPPAQGVNLRYHWSLDEELLYNRRTSLANVTDKPDADPVVTSTIQFVRTVEDASNPYYLIRDKIQPDGQVSDHGSIRLVSTAYNIKSKYRTVDEHGLISQEMAPLSPGDHFGFPIPVLPIRMKSVGDSWQVPIQFTAQWASVDPIKVNGQATLEGFEWQDGYPTAKIRESYTGPATFSDSSGRISVTISDLKVDRVYYFAYNSGRLIRMETNVDGSGNFTSSEMAALGLSSGGGGGRIQLRGRLWFERARQLRARLIQLDTPAELKWLSRRPAIRSGRAIQPVDRAHDGQPRRLGTSAGGGAG